MGDNKDISSSFDVGDQNRRGHPVQVVRLDKKSNGLELDLDGLKEICLDERCHDKELCIVSIAGDYRKGKSFMLNFFLRYLYYISDEQKKLKIEKSDEAPDTTSTNDWLGDRSKPLQGFSWRSGTKPETTGIVIWSEPIIIKTDDGKEVAVLLMDTQGAFDSRQTIRQTAITFALSTLTSSIQIYNIMNNIQENDLQVLDIFLGYGQLALEASKEKPFQQLVFLIRDWRWPDEYEYGVEGGNRLLNDRMHIEDEPDSQDLQIRDRIKSCFDKTMCYLMPYPGENVSENSKFKGCLSDMKENFVDNLGVFVPKILAPENLVTKNIGGAKVTGRTLIEYFRAYSEAFKGEVPEAKCMYEATAEASNLAAVAIAKNHYTSLMKDVCGVSKPYINPRILEDRHVKLLKESMDLFKTAKKLGSSDYSLSFQENLSKELLSSYEEFIEHNNQKNMFNMWGSPLILLIFWFVTFTLNRIFDLIGISPLANLFYAQSMISFFSVIVYLSLK